MEGLLAQPPAQHRQAVGDGVIHAHAVARMVAMPVRDDGGGDRAPGIDVEIARRAVHAFGSQHDEITGGRRHADRLRNPVYKGGEVGPC